jgi:DNA-binding MarR family transcriptional regulator
MERPEHVIGQPVRLRMLTALAEKERLTFNQLLEHASTNCGGMSHHARRLEAFGYITTRKSFVGRMPLTEYQLTSEGRRALATFLDRRS